MIRAEISSLQQSIDTYRSKISVLVEEETSLANELKSMESVITQYEELISQNEKLQKAIDKEKGQLEELTRQRRRTYDNLLTSEEYVIVHDISQKIFIFTKSILISI